jgi:hypothetical protein
MVNARQYPAQLRILAGSNTCFGATRDGPAGTGAPSQSSRRLPRDELAPTRGPSSDRSLSTRPKGPPGAIRPSARHDGAGIGAVGPVASWAGVIPGHRLVRARAVATGATAGTFTPGHTG